MFLCFIPCFQPASGHVFIILVLCVFPSLVNQVRNLIPSRWKTGVILIINASLHHIIQCPFKPFLIKRLVL